MFSYKQYSEYEKIQFGLPEGYIQAVGYPCDICNNVENLIEEIQKSPNNQHIMIVWENDYQERNGKVWEYYTNNIIPHNFKPPYIQQDRSKFDDYCEQVSAILPNEGQIDFADIHNFVDDTSLGQICSVLHEKKLTIFGSIYEHVPHINTKSARNE